MAWVGNHRDARFRPRRVVDFYAGSCRSGRCRRRRPRCRPTARGRRPRQLLQRPRPAPRLRATRVKQSHECLANSRRDAGAADVGLVEWRDETGSLAHSFRPTASFEGTLDMRRGDILGSAGAAGNWKPPLGAAGLEPNCSPVAAGAARARATSFILSCRFCLTTVVLSQKRMRLCHHSQAFGKRHAPPRDPRAPAGALVALSIVLSARFIRSACELLSRRCPRGRGSQRASSRAGSRHVNRQKTVSHTG
jgi:hypothetical protein